LAVRVRESTAVNAPKQRVRASISTTGLFVTESTDGVRAGQNRTPCMSASSGLDGRMRIGDPLLARTEVTEPPHSYLCCCSTAFASSSN
jgi:hypothetical protein